MSESFIEPDSLNSILLSLGAIVDENGSTRFLNKELASYNFDGVIPTSSDTILVNELKPGMSFLPIGETEGSLKTVIKVEFDDPEMTSSPTSDYIISYLGTNGDIQTLTYDGAESVEVYFEDWDDKVLGDNGWIITQEGNAIFSNVAVRGRIEATEGFLEDLGITGTLTVESGGSIVIGTDPGILGNPGIIIDDTGLFAFDSNENLTLSITASTGTVLISALDQVIEDLEEFVNDEFDDLDSLLSASYVVNFQIFNPGTTLISGNKISTGTIDANSVSISSGLGGATQGVKINSNGITAYDTLGSPTFSLNSSTGNATFRGTVSGSEVVGSTFKSNTSITANSGNGVYLDNFGQVRFADPDAILTFDANGLNITNQAGNSTLTFNSSGLTLSGTGLTINNADINLSGGSITSTEFSIDTLGNATFSGTLSAADGTFAGSLSAATGTFSGTLSAGISISSPTITGGTISGTRIQTAAVGTRVRLSDDVSTPFGVDDAIEFMEGSTSRTVLAWSSGDQVFDFFGPFFQFIGRNGVSSTYVDVFGTLEANFVTSNGSIRALAVGSQIAPSTFTNAQTALQIRVSDNVIGIQSSTLDIKTNIIPLNEEFLNIVPEEKSGGSRDNLSFDPNDIFTISPVEYVVIEDETQSRQVGFIVEDLLEKWPQAVTYGQDNIPVSYNTNSIVAGLVYAVKTLKDRIDYLENKINELEGTDG